MAARIKLVNLLGYFLLLALSLADAYLLNNRFGYTPLLFLLLLLPVDALCALRARRSVRCLSSPDFQESERGAPAEFPYAYQNSSHFLVCRLGITLRLTGPKGARCGKSKAVLNLAPGATEIRFSVAPRHIGVYQAQVKSVRAYGPLGIFSVKLPAARSAAAVVTPSRGTAAAAYGPDADSARGIEGNDRILDGGRSASGNYNGVREYEPGDPLRSIHWKLTAHNHKMMTRLFEEEEEGYATVAVDLRPVPGPAEQALCVQDQLCESAYRSVLDRVEQGAKVRLVFFEGDSLRTIRVQSEADLTEAAVSLAAAGPAFEALADAPDALPAGGEALMVSASLDTALARRMGELSDAGGSAMLLLVAPARFERQDFQADFDCLREHGVDYTITEAARTRRGRKERLQIDRVSGEGREQ